MGAFAIPESGAAGMDGAAGIAGLAAEGKGALGIIDGALGIGAEGGLGIPAGATPAMPGGFGIPGIPGGVGTDVVFA